MNKQWLLAAVAVAGLAGSQAMAQAVIDSDAPLNPAPPASFQAVVTYDSSLSQLQFDIKNTSPFDNGGFFTGFLFNLPGGAAASYIDPLPDQGFQQISTTTVAPYGTFDVGVALGGEFFSGGDAENGLFPTENQTFFFNITLGGSAAGAALNVQDFLDLATDDGSEPAVLVARFRSFEAGEDQIVPVLARDIPPVIPLPAAAWSALSGMGMLVMPMAWRRLKRQA